MEILSLVALALVILGLAYCIRSLRALHTKLSKKSEQISREIHKAAVESKKSSMTAYRQTEAFIQLSNLLQFKAAIPPTRSWAASPDLLLLISETVKKSKPSLVVELGSGVSTLVVAKSGARKVISIDNSEEFGGKTRELIREHKARGVEIRIAPLRPYANGGEWYEVSALKDLKKIDLLIIDGPPGSKNPEARYPALKELKDKLSSKATIIIDDVNRDGERKLAEDFAKALPTHTITFFDHEKGTAVISPR
ncbi:MAG: class I SAM-dependent methyltransferase [Candidatus Planktophila sp.]|nr:class I SAM-dependent methyltransferase [Candidatus Planktophila sp.]